jgi:hypothetical protein
MFTVAREMIREDSKKVSMRVHVKADVVEVNYSLEGSETVQTTRYTPLEADMLLDLLSIQDQHAEELGA